MKSQMKKKFWNKAVNTSKKGIKKSFPALTLDR